VASGSPPHSVIENPPHNHQSVIRWGIRPVQPLATVTHARAPGPCWVLIRQPHGTPRASQQGPPRPADPRIHSAAGHTPSPLRDRPLRQVLGAGAEPAGTYRTPGKLILAWRPTVRRGQCPAAWPVPVGQLREWRHSNHHRTLILLSYSSTKYGPVTPVQRSKRWCK
jgi:hypothetical protein